MSGESQRVIQRLIADLMGHPGNARTHSKRQLRQLAASIEKFGFTNPVLVSDDGEIIAGHGRVQAAKLLGLESVPTLALSHLSADERRGYMLADNKIALNAGWDGELLSSEFEALLELDFDLDVTGFAVEEVDLALSNSLLPSGVDREGALPRLPARPLTRPGDIWQLGKHRLLCGDARDPTSYQRLLQGDRAELIFTDPPYNIAPAVRGLAKVKHDPFQMGAGEMSGEEFTDFLATTLGHAAKACRNGAIAFVCMDWRHMGEILSAGLKVFSELKNLCVWNKSTAGLGSFYRSKHELVFVFKYGQASHTNNFGLGRKGRYRTNVWDYPGLTSAGPSRGHELALHPTVKPIAMVADAIRDCSKHGSIVLDPFAGAGTTLLAACETGRRARLIEIDPKYCDIIVQRYNGDGPRIRQQLESGGARNRPRRPRGGSGA